MESSGPAFKEPIAPKMTVAGRLAQLIKLHKLDRENSQIRHDPEIWQNRP